MHPRLDLVRPSPEEGLAQAWPQAQGDEEETFSLPLVRVGKMAPIQTAPVEGGGREERTLAITNWGCTILAVYSLCDWGYTMTSGHYGPQVCSGIPCREFELLYLLMIRRQPMQLFSSKKVEIIFSCTLTQTSAGTRPSALMVGELLQLVPPSAHAILIFYSMWRVTHLSHYHDDTYCACAETCTIPVLGPPLSRGLGMRLVWHLTFLCILLTGRPCCDASTDCLL